MHFFSAESVGNNRPQMSQICADGLAVIYLLYDLCCFNRCISVLVFLAKVFYAESAGKKYRPRMAQICAENHGLSSTHKNHGSDILFVLT
jgi:hypothetical protein